MLPSIETLKLDIKRLQSAPPKSTFGADSHGFELYPSLTDSEVADFEEQHGVALPPEYRDFLVHIGNGGAGPAHGVFRLGVMDNGFGHAKWHAKSDFVGDLSAPFPLTGAWNDLTGEPEYDETNEDQYEIDLEVFEQRYWSTENVNGAVPVCHLGCAYRQWLVVTGDEAGNVWCDDRADRKGIYPLADDASTRFTFVQWYRQWLDGLLESQR